MPSLADNRMSWQGPMYRGQSKGLTMDEEGGVTTIVHKQVRAAAIRPCQHLLCAPPVFLQGLSLPCEHCCCVASHGCCSMVLQEADIIKYAQELHSRQHGNKKALLQGLNQCGSHCCCTIGPYCCCCMDDYDASQLLGACRCMSWRENKMQVYPCHSGSAQAVKTQSFDKHPNTVTSLLRE